MIKQIAIVGGLWAASAVVRGVIEGLTHPDEELEPMDNIVGRSLSFAIDDFLRVFQVGELVYALLTAPMDEIPDNETIRMFKLRIA